jgi:hypothetical protein
MVMVIIIYNKIMILGGYIYFRRQCGYQKLVPLIPDDVYVNILIQVKASHS